MKTGPWPNKQKEWPGYASRSFFVPASSLDLSQKEDKKQYSGIKRIFRIFLRRKQSHKDDLS